MACDSIYSGRLDMSCKTVIGGLKNLYIVDLFNSTLKENSTITNGVLTATTTTNRLYKFELMADANTYSEENEISRANGTSFFNQSGNFSLKMQDSETQDLLQSLLKTRVQVIIEDRQGNFRMAGLEYGVDFAANTSSGGSIGDLNGYTLSFTGKEQGLATYIDSNLIGNTEEFTSCLLDSLELSGYFPNYRDVKVLQEQINWNHLTTLIYFGSVPQADGSITITNTTHFEASVLAASENITPTVLAIGGYYESEHFSTIAASESLRQAFANSCLTLCQTHNLKGINIDWEFPIAGEEDSVVLLFEKLYQTLNPQGYQVSTAVNASPIGLPVWKAEVFQYVDIVYAMSYDDDREGVTNHSSLSYLIESLEALKALGVPKNKILGGIPAYTRGNEVLTYKELLDGATDKDAVFNNSSYDGKSYNGADIINNKVQYILNNGYRGLFFWELGQDSYNEYSLLDEAFSGLSRCMDRKTVPVYIEPPYTLGLELITYSDMSSMLYPWSFGSFFGTDATSDGSIATITLTADYPGTFTRIEQSIVTEISEQYFVEASINTNGKDVRIIATNGDTFATIKEKTFNSNSLITDSLSFEADTTNIIIQVLIQGVIGDEVLIDSISAKKKIY